MADVTRLAGVVISETAVSELIAAIERLERLAAPRGMCLSPRLELIKRELLTSTTRVHTSADTSAEAVTAQHLAQFEASVVDTTTAAQQLGITRDGVTWLCRNKTLRAARSGGRWFIEQASLTDHQAHRARAKEA